MRKTGYAPTPVEDRFWKYVIPEPMSGCWLWDGAIKSEDQPYGVIRGNAPTETAPLLLAHRLSYEMHVGPIPDGLQIDHLCRNKNCVNPRHLEAVTPKENSYRVRGDGLAGATIANAGKTHCIRGHELFGDNLVAGINRNGRIRRDCRICRATRDHQSYLRKKARKNVFRDPEEAA